ncbi:MAG: S8/S53 family peptidase [Pseudomonadota bacterium]
MIGLFMRQRTLHTHLTLLIASVLMFHTALGDEREDKPEHTDVIANYEALADIQEQIIETTATGPFDDSQLGTLMQEYRSWRVELQQMLADAERNLSISVADIQAQTLREMSQQGESESRIRSEITLQLDDIVDRVLANADWRRRVAAEKRVAAEQGVTLLYDDKELSDEEKARLARLLVELVPDRKWTKVPVPSDAESLSKWVAERYNLDDERGELVSVLNQAIVSVNDIGDWSQIGGRDLKVPPYPPDTEDCFSGAWFACILNGFSARDRVFDDGLQNYATVTETTLLDSDAQEEPKRSAGEVAKGIGQTRIALARMASIQPWLNLGQLIPRQALIATKDQMVGVRLLASDADYDVWQSAYSATGIRALSTHSQAELVERAKSRPMFVLDVGFESGHGSKVYSAIEMTLDKLGVAFLSSAKEQADRPIRLIDLWPRTRDDTKTLKRFVSNYAVYLTGIGASATEVGKLKTGAEKWIDETVADQGETLPKNYKVHEFVLFAVFHHIVAVANSDNVDGVIVSVSMEFSSTAYKLFLERELYEEASDGQVLIFAAAGEGRSWSKLSPFAVPQNLAFFLDSVINVAGLACNGKSGSAMSSDRAPPVHIVARGCGYSHGTLKPSDYGSSFATPVVATSTWLRSIIAGKRNRVGIDVEQVIEATRPVPYHFPTHSQLSRGIFDPFSSIRELPSHVVVDGTVRRVTACNISLAFFGQAGPTLLSMTVGSPVEDEAAAGYTQYVDSIEMAQTRCSDNPETDCLWVRYKVEGQRLQAFESKRLSGAEMSFVTADPRVVIEVNLDNVRDKMSFASCKRQALGGI